MATANQSLLSRLGFKDLDKQNPRHGLACEYLKEKMTPFAAEYMSDMYFKFAESESKELCKRWQINFDISNETNPSDWRAWHDIPDDEIKKSLFDQMRKFQRSGVDEIKLNLINQYAELSSIIKGPSSGTKGFLDVSFRGHCAFPLFSTLSHKHGEYNYLFSKKPREYYSYNVNFKICIWGEVKIAPVTPEILLQQIEYYAQNLPQNDMIWVLADFDISDFKRMAEKQFPQLKCFQLGENFDKWCKQRHRPVIQEL